MKTNKNFIMYLKEQFKQITLENIFFLTVISLLIFIMLKLITTFEYGFMQIVGMIVPFFYFLLCFLYIATYKFQRVVTRIVLGIFIFYGTVIKTKNFLMDEFVIDEKFILNILIVFIIIKILNGFQFHKSKRYSTRVYYLRNLFNMDDVLKCNEVIKRQEKMEKEKRKSKNKSK